ncbi:MAG: ATP-binding protein [Lachnospiraceae bacterium]|nr:ATP-binding protein [Lachnospiraceae bacterium]
MKEEKKHTAEEAVWFLNVLESENEEQLIKFIEEIQNVEQEIREIDYTLQSLEKKQDSSINFFSPVGVYEEGEEKRSLLRKVEELKEKLPVLNEKLEQYKYRKEQLQYLKNVIGTTLKDAFSSEEKSAENNDTERNNAESCVRGLYILETQEYDRSRIARDLHDSSVQSLTSLVHKTEFCMKLVDIDTVRVKLELQTMIETIKTVINGMREIIYDLRPMSLNNLGLAVTMDSYCLQLQKDYDLKVNFQVVSEEPSDLLPIWKVTLYRILQEACSNIVKHAKASQIDILLSYENDKALLKIKDNGTGFDTKVLPESDKEELHGFGLSIMRERVALLDGTISIESVVDSGTTIIVEVPLKTEKEEKNG